MLLLNSTLYHKWIALCVFALSHVYHLVYELRAAKGKSFKWQEKGAILNAQYILNRNFFVLKRTQKSSRYWIFFSVRTLCNDWISNGYFTVSCRTARYCKQIIAIRRIMNSRSKIWNFTRPPILYWMAVKINIYIEPIEYFQINGTWKTLQSYWIHL